MKIIQIETNPSGSRPALQDWSSNIVPDGYALCPEEFVDIFYSTTPAGFVNINVNDNIVTSMEVNQNALDEYIASLPEPEAIVEKPTQLDLIEAQVTYTAMMTDTLLEV